MRNKRAWHPKMTEAWTSWTSIGFGLMLYYLFVPNFAGPLGLVWGIPHGKKRFEVYGSFVDVSSRRCGVRSRINRQIQEHFEIITTDTGTKDGGLAFLKARGYKYNKSVQCYVLQTPRRSKP